MDVVGKLLLWVHLLGLAMGVAGGMGIGQVGPRMQQAGTAAPLLAGMLKVFKMAARTGLVLLLITGFGLVFVKYGGFGGLGVWFQVKMALVVLFVILIGFSEWGQARVGRGDMGGAKVAAVSGPLTMLTVVAIVLTAVFAFY